MFAHRVEDVFADEQSDRLAERVDNQQYLVRSRQQRN
jgi:hypothetical protein